MGELGRKRRQRACTLQQIRVGRNVRQTRVDEEPRLDHALRRPVRLQGGEEDKAVPRRLSGRDERVKKNVFVVGQDYAQHHYAARKSRVAPRGEEQQLLSPVWGDGASNRAQARPAEELIHDGGDLFPRCEHRELRAERRSDRDEMQEVELHAVRHLAARKTMCTPVEATRRRRAVDKRARVLVHSKGKACNAAQLNSNMARSRRDSILKNAIARARARALGLNFPYASSVIRHWIWPLIFNLFSIGKLQIGRAHV